MSRPLRAWLLLAAHVIQAAALLTATITTASGSTPIQNAGFETVDGGRTCQSIPGWTLNGSPTSAISVVEDADGPALKISNGKAFCYGLGIDPAADYVLTIQVRTEKARPRVETEPPLPGGQPVQGSQTTFDWKTIEFRLPSAQRPSGVRECWIALGAEPVEAGGAVWYRSVRLEPIGGGPNAVRNPTFSDPVVETTVPPGWSMESGGAGITCDSEQALEGSHGLRVTGVGRPVRISQPVDMAALNTAGTRRIRISGWGKSRGLGSDRIHLEVYGASTLQGPLLSLSGDADWTKGEAVIELGQQQGRKFVVCINAPRDFQGDAWFDDIRIEPVPDDEVVNLLSNTSFHPSIANARLPDYWGLWGDAVLCVEPWTLDLFSLVDDPGPFPPARVLRVQHPRPGNFVPTPPNKRLAMFVLTGSKLVLPQGHYTFSIYAKADRPDTAVHIRHPSHEMPLKIARIGPKWQRIEATGTNALFLAAIHVPDPGSVVWLSAPQLEPGTRASAFRPSPGEGGILPPREPAVARSPLRADTGEATRPPGFPLAVYAEYDHVLNEPGVRARVEWGGPVPATVHWRLLDAITGAKLPVQQQSIDVDEPGTHTFIIPTANLPLGAIGIHAVADSGGKRAGRAFDVFAKLAGSTRDIRLNRFTRSLTVDGAPMLPIFLPIEPATLGDWHLDRIVKAGFNCLAAAPGKLSQQEILRGAVAPEKVAAIRRQLDRLHTRGVGLLWPIPWTFDDWAKTSDLYGGNVARLATTYRAVISAFRDHPAILGWYLMDEPSPLSWESEYGFTESDLHALWFAVKEADPGRPAYVNWNHSWQVEPYGGFHCTDIIGHDNYEISGESYDYSALLPGVKMVNDVRKGRRPAFAWISGSYDELAMRPSAGAVRVHAWLHLIHGTRGLGYWSKPPMDPLVWDAMKTINREATAFHKHVFGDSDASLRSIASRSATIQHALWTTNDFAYLAAVNTADGARPFHIDIAAACGRDVASGRRLYDDGPLRLESGVLNDECAPLSRYLYRFMLAPSAP